LNFLLVVFNLVDVTSH